MKSKAFTLIELLIVIAILGIIASVAVSMYHHRNYLEVRVSGMRYDAQATIKLRDKNTKIKIDSEELQKDLKEVIDRHIDLAVKNLR